MSYGNGPNRYNNNNDNYGGRNSNGYRAGNRRSGGYRRREPSPLFPPPNEEEIIFERNISMLFRFADNQVGDKQILQLFAQTVKTAYNGSPASVLKAFQLCVTQLPQKSSAFATMTGLLNLIDYDITAAFIKTVSDALQESLSRNEFRTVKILFRYLAELVNASVILPAQLIGLFDIFLAVLREENVRVERADAFIYVILATIPWAAAELHYRTPNELTRVLTTIEQYMASRKATAHQSGIAAALEVLKPYRDLPDCRPYEQGDRLELLWAQIKQLGNADEWETKILNRMSVLFETEFNNELQHDLPALVVPGNDVQIKFSYQPKFWVFDDSVHTPENAIIKLPPVFSISRFILDDIIYDINYLEGGGYNIFAAIAETLFSEIVRLPRSQEVSVYYATLLGDLTKEDLASFPKVLGRAVRILYSRLDDDQHVNGGMDVECIRRLSEWFAVHLSNFTFQWKWQDWEAVLDADPSSGKFVFVRETLEKCVRLSYYDRISKTVPPDFIGKVLPASAPVQHFKYENAEHTRDETLHKLITRLQRNFAVKNPEDPKDPGPARAAVADTLQMIRNHASGRPISTSQMNIDGGATDGLEAGSGIILGDEEAIAREAFLQCFLKIGGRSLSHLLNVAEKVMPILRDYNTTPDARAHIVRIVAEFCAENSQSLEIFLGKFMDFRVVDPSTVLQWLLAEDMISAHCNRFASWSILRMTLNKVTFKITEIEEKIEIAKANLGKPANEKGATPEDIRRLENSLDAARRERKDAIITVFARLTNSINGRIKESDRQGIDPRSTAWWRWIVGNFREIARAFETEVRQNIQTLNAVLFISGELDARLVKVWEEIKAMYDRHTDYLV
ncbi:Nuclear cap-binding protein subunit 1 [Rhizophlyctis rosea]|uniref:Nuclear cap-binding protein subunit 1 n=1 Tax=Rhizophlyctis rosea TaxID=64517 RepID=A0AAD5X5V5_9FUNG|nr:Nuclear cap-binding protein subunit 1 [Rhizophlyctis rosea]